MLKASAYTLSVRGGNFCCLSFCSKHTKHKERKMEKSKCEEMLVDFANEQISHLCDELNHYSCSKIAVNIKKMEKYIVFIGYKNVSNKREIVRTLLVIAAPGPGGIKESTRDKARYLLQKMGVDV